MNGVLWFLVGAATATVCFVVAGIVIAKRQRRVKFFAGVLLPSEQALLMRLQTQFRTLPADEHSANLELLRSLNMIKQVGTADILTPLGTQVARYIEAKGTWCAS